MPRGAHEINYHSFASRHPISRHTFVLPLFYTTPQLFSDVNDFLSPKKVFWDGREIGTTVVRRKTLNPVWASDTESPATLVGKKSVRPKNSKGGREKEAHVVADEEEHKDEPCFWLRSACSSNPRLRVELYDWDALGSHDFLGGVELDAEDVVELQRRTLALARMNSGKEDDKVCAFLSLYSAVMWQPGRPAL